MDPGSSPSKLATRVRFLPEVLTYHVKFQKRAGFCGPASVVNAFRCLGEKVPEVQIGAAAGCTPEGCPPEKLTEAIRQFGHGAVSFETKDKNSAWGMLVASLRDGKPVIVLVMEWGHYVTVAGLLGDRVIMVDSTNTQRNKAENGVHVLSRREFMKRWFCSSEGAYCGISVGKK